MALTYHGDDFLLESEPEYQDMLDDGLARYFDVKCLGRIGPGFRAEGRFLKRYVSWSVDGFVWHGDLVKVGQSIALMETAGCRSSAVPGSKATGHGRRDVGSVTKLAQPASSLMMYISTDGSDLQFSSKTVTPTSAKPPEITKSRVRKIARYMEDKPVLECVCAYQSEVAECMAFGDRLGRRSRDKSINNGGAGEAWKPLH